MSTFYTYAGMESSLPDQNTVQANLRRNHAAMFVPCGTYFMHLPE